MPECAVLGCKPEPGASFHHFPRDPILRQQWLEFIQRHCGQSLKDVERTRVCSGHFSQESFINFMQKSLGFTKRLILSPDAVPSIYEIPAASGGQHMVETDQDWNMGRKEVGCQWESPEGERREVGCQSESAESRDAAVQVDISAPAGVWNIPWQHVSITADDPGGGMTNSLNTGPLLYPTGQPLLPTMPLFGAAPQDLQQLHLVSLLPSVPLYQSLPLLLQGNSPLLQTLNLPSVPLWNTPPPVGVQHDASPLVRPADTPAGPPPGLIAPLSPRLAEDEDKEEGSLLNRGEGLSKCSSVISEKKKRRSVCKKNLPSGTVPQKTSSHKNEDYRQRVLHPVERSSVINTLHSVQPMAQTQHTPADGGEGDEGAVEPSKKKNELVERPRRNTVGPPIRYLIESELRSCRLTAANHSAEKVKRKIEKKRREDEGEGEGGGVGVAERTDSSRVESSNDGAVGGWRKPCQVCGLVFTKEASLLLHLSVHRTDHKFCHKRFSDVNTLHVHNDCHHHGNRDGAHDSKDNLCESKVTATADNQREVEVNTNTDEENDREKTNDKGNKKLLPSPSTVAPDWSRHRNRNRWSDFRNQMKRRQDNMERWRRLKGTYGGGERKRKRREKEEENKDVKRTRVTLEAGEEEKEEKRVCVKVSAQGEDVERRTEERGREREVMEPLHRPRRKMVGPTIRYLLESEEQSTLTANQGRRKPQKKSKAGGGASDNTGLIDRSVDTEGQTDWTNQNTENITTQKRERSKKVVLYGASGTRADHMASERETGHVVLKRETGHMASERETGHVVLKRETGHMASERETGHVVLKRETGHMASERETGHMAPQDTVNTVKRREGPKTLMIGSRAGGVVSDRQTGQVVLDRQTGDIVSWRQTGHMETDRQTSYRASVVQTTHMVPETGAKIKGFVIYRDAQDGQLTTLSPCCVRLQRLL